MREKAEASQALRPDHSIPADTRRYLLEGRNGLIYLPTHGPHGGLLKKVADACSVSRQFVHLTLFPDDVEDMFGTSISARMVWAHTAKIVYGHTLYEPMMKAFTTLKKDRKVILRVPVKIITFFVARAQAIGLNATITDTEPTFPATYEVTLVE